MQRTSTSFWLWLCCMQIREAPVKDKKKLWTRRWFTHTQSTCLAALSVVMHWHILHPEQFEIFYSDNLPSVLFALYKLGQRKHIKLVPCLPLTLAVVTAGFRLRDHHFPVKSKINFIISVGETIVVRGFGLSVSVNSKFCQYEALLKSHCRTLKHIIYAYVMSSVLL